MGHVKRIMRAAPGRHPCDNSRKVFSWISFSTAPAAPDRARQKSRTRESRAPKSFRFHQQLRRSQYPGGLDCAR
jgi:hypothetical protein